MLEIFVDADACAVKEEIYRVAKRHGLTVTLVANAPMRHPAEPWVRLVVVEGRFDAADDWITDHAQPDDLVISGDIPLAARCLEKGARVIGPTGKAFTRTGISEALAAREILGQMRDMGLMTKGPAPFGKKDRSRFLQALEETIRRVRRDPRPAPPG
ncbi:MAG: YaiI/YqxD family protein [Acidobacteria bacterium]|nr:YaiI/YqxD family protein [Acidobacteriota bacterium]